MRNKIMRHEAEMEREYLDQLMKVITTSTRIHHRYFEYIFSSTYR